MTKKRFQSSRLKVAVAALILALLVAVPALASDTIVLTVNGEGRSASVTGATLDSVDYSHQAQTSQGSISLSVDDRSATDAGWSVTLQAGDFVDGDRTVPASNFSVVQAGSPAHIDGQEIDETNGPKVPDGGANGSLDSPRKVLHAQEDFGAGNYEQVLDVELLVPGQTPAGSYVSNLTVNITAGP